MQGTVKWFSEDKGYGFINSGDKDYFVYFKEIIADGYKLLKPGQTVSFTPDSSGRGLQAKEVKVQS